VLEKERIARDLIQRNNELEQFTYIISHNLRAPLANIIGITDMMNTFSLTVKEEDEMRTELISSVKKLDMIIRDLNSILQTKQELTDRKELVSFKEICDDINLSIRNLIKKQKVTIRTNFSDKENMISVKSYLYSIFYNLILNSIKYRQMELDPVIKIRSAVNEGKLSLIFEDNGIGIDLETQGEHMFGMYKRFHTHQEGKGLGLFMVKSQVESLGGKIFVESEVNIGTKFIVEFDLYHS
jgi:signal transduction histidine kinase